MALKVIGSINGMYHAKYIENIAMTNAEDPVVGQGYYLASGAWTKSATTAAVEAVCVRASTPPVMEVVKAGDIIEADYIGTPDAAFKAGLSVAILDANGANINSATVTGGHLRVLNVDPVNTKAQVIAHINFTVRDNDTTN